MNRIGRPLVRLQTVTSTMDVARALLMQDAPAGTSVLAGYQSQGRGRSNRLWEALPWSSVLMSFITRSDRPMAELGLLSLLWGWAVAETVEEISGQAASIKWPNDVLVDDRKISGVLVTNIPLRGENWQITGIGLNVSATEGELPPAAISLAMLNGVTPTVDDVLPVLLSHINDAWDAFASGDNDLVRLLIAPRLAMVGEAVTVEDGSRLLQGTVAGVSSDGALLLTDPSGAEVRVVAGEVTRGPRRT